MNFRENWLRFWGFGGEVEFILGIWIAKAFRELGIFFQGFWNINTIILGSKEGQNPLGASPLIVYPLQQC